MVRQPENQKKKHAKASFVGYRNEGPSVQGTVGETDDTSSLQMLAFIRTRLSILYFPIVLKFQILLLLMKLIYESLHFMSCSISFTGF